MLETITVGLVGIDGRLHLREPFFADFFPAALLGLGIFGPGRARSWLAVPAVRRARTRTRSATGSSAERLVHTYGWDTLAYFALRDDKSFFFSSDGEAMIAYTYMGGYALAVGRPDRRARSRSRSSSTSSSPSAHERAWKPAFLAVRESDLAAVRSRGLHHFYLGDEAIIRLRPLRPRGQAGRACASPRAGSGARYRFQLMAESDAAPRLVEQLNAISARWRGKDPERGFTMALSQDVEGREPGVPAVRRARRARQARGFLRVVPAYGPTFGYTLDLMRHDPDAPNGMTEFLIAPPRLALASAAWSGCR